jgi:O-antigen ligase
MVAARTLRLWVLAGAVFLLLPFALYAPAQITALVVIIAGLAWTLSWIEGRPLWPTADRALAGVLVVLLVWGGVSALWSIDPQTSLERVPRLFGIFLAGLVLLAAVRDLRSTERRFLEYALLAGVLAGIVLLAIEMATDLAVFRALRTVFGGGAPPDDLKVFNRAATVLALLLWPALASLWKRRPRVMTPVLLIVVVVILSGLKSFAAIVALGLALPFAALAGTWLRPGLLGAALIIVTAFLATPLLSPALVSDEGIRAPLSALPSSLRHRAHIWSFVAERIAERPLFGWGLDSSRAIPGGHGLLLLSPDPPSPSTATNGGAEMESLRVERLPLHPHNAVLQIWLELGAVGAAIALAFMLLALERLRRLALSPHFRWKAGLCIGFLVTALTIAFASYGVWQTWWLASLWLVGALTAGTVESNEGAKEEAET